MAKLAPSEIIVLSDFRALLLLVTDDVTLDPHPTGPVCSVWLSAMVLGRHHRPSCWGHSILECGISYVYPRGIQLHDGQVILGD